jgi:hypothetical protein
MEKKIKKNLLKGFLITVSILVLVILGLGFSFPGLIWTRSLGVTYTQTDYNSIMDKLNYTKDAAPTGDSKDLYNYIYGPANSVDTQFTSEELTAFFNENRPSYYPLKNVQVKINDDGTIELSASANVDYFLNDVLGGKYTREQIENEVPTLGILPDNVNIYVKFTGSVTQNISYINVKALTVQGVAISESYFSTASAANVISTGVNDFITKSNAETGSSYESIYVENGVVIFKGSVPSSLERVAK